jgi:hypothetical protein
VYPARQLLKESPLVSVVKRQNQFGHMIDNIY